MTVRGYAACEAGQALRPLTYEQAEPGPLELAVRIQYRGIMVLEA